MGPGLKQGLQGLKLRRGEACANTESYMERMMGIEPSFSV